ncbi:hypothetical protein D4S03_05480 [bacterium]|nr:MAG: hypothetical protein D4S03_05480 [bacterium]
MAEIKSTLDIIMERTKNLTMTDEEKASFRRKDAEGKVKGWIQKYQDGVIEIDTLRSDFEKEVTEYPEVLHILKTQLLDCVKLNGENGRVLRLLEDILGISAETIENIIQSFKREIDILRIKRIESLGKELKERKIYGSSVAPNPDHGGDWQENIVKAESDLREQLKSLVK